MPVEGEYGLSAVKRRRLKETALRMKDYGRRNRSAQISAMTRGKVNIQRRNTRRISTVLKPIIMNEPVCHMFSSIGNVSDIAVQNKSFLGGVLC